MTMQTSMIDLEIVADFVCPWCFIGLRRLESALDRVRLAHPGLPVRTRWRPFFLNPNTPPEGEPYLPFLIRKFGSREAVDALFARVREAGAIHGVDFSFERIPLRANTLQAHRLVRWAQQQGPVDALVERIFIAQFQNGEYIGDRALLARLAGESGFDAGAAAAWLASDADTAAVRMDEAHLRTLGIRMVPSFIVAKREIVVGAEDPATLAAAIERHLA